MHKRIVIAVLATLIAFAAFAGDPMAGDEKARLADHLNRTADTFEKSIEGLTEAQWTYKAAPERWSIAECSEHIIASESFIRDRITGALEEPATAELLVDARKEDVVEKMLLDRSKKFQAPEPIQPTAKKFATPKEAIEAFRAERAKTLALAQEERDLRAFAAAGPSGTPLDAYTWFIFLSSHTGRHTLQIEEVKTDANYPR